MTRWGHGVVIGKFLPPHAGHLHLIERARARVERLTAIVCQRPEDPIPGARRLAWLQELAPGVETVLVDDRWDPSDSALWARLTLGWLGARPDVAFTSEDYGEAWARAMGCAHVLVDRERTAVPVSGSAVRADPLAAWEHLPPPVRAWYALRVVVLGAESTGTTTLARALAERLCTRWVPEYGREYSAEKYGRGDRRWRGEELVAIAREQARREDAAAREADRVLVCDTDPFATLQWHRRYVGGPPPAELVALARERRPHLYLLTGDELPFAQDGLRDGEHVRRDMHQWFLEALREQSVPWRLVTGPHARRLDAALGEVERLARGSSWRPGARPCCRRDRSWSGWTSALSCCRAASRTSAPHCRARWP